MPMNLEDNFDMAKLKQGLRIIDRLIQIKCIKFILIYLCFLYLKHKNILFT